MAREINPTDESVALDIIIHGWLDAEFVHGEAAHSILFVQGISLELQHFKRLRENSGIKLQMLSPFLKCPDGW